MKQLFSMFLVFALIFTMGITVFAAEEGGENDFTDDSLTQDVGAEYTAGSEAVNAGTIYSVSIDWTSIGTLHYQGATGGTYTWNPNTLQYELSGNSDASWTDASVEINVTNKSNTSILVQAKYTDAGTGAQTQMKDWTDNAIEVGVGSAATDIDYTDTVTTGAAQTETITGIVTAEGSITQNIDTVGTITLTLHERGATIWEIEDGVLSGVALGESTDLVIPDDVTAIAPYAFKDQTEITSIVIPSSVTSIGEGAFENCTGLEIIGWDLSNNMQQVALGVFDGCTANLNVYIWMSSRCSGCESPYGCYEVNGTFNSIENAAGALVIPRDIERHYIHEAEFPGIN